MTDWFPSTAEIVSCRVLLVRWTNDGIAYLANPGLNGAGRKLRAVNVGELEFN
jgi:hypothetical protein